MSDNEEEKTFSLCQVFNFVKNMEKDEERDGDVVKRFGVYWKIQLRNDTMGDTRYVYPHLICESPQSGSWSVSGTCDIIVGGNPFKTGEKFEFDSYKKRLNSSYVYTGYFPEYRIGDSAAVEYHVTINKMTGIKEKEKSMNFDDDVAKESSDAVLVVGDQKFYVNKMYLSFHSKYFKSLFSGNFEESGKSEIELKDIDPKDFQEFLEVLYAVSSIEDDNVFKILKLSDFLAAEIIFRRCEDFFMDVSKESLKFKLQLTTKYKLPELRKKCFNGMTKSTNFKDLIPENSADFDSEVWKEFFLKAISLI
ncbi:hypothetical protein B9Z55_007939 [Caenorhabditis nigoni]|uniref:BTB domain-containing protein n=1 Tax=Caenorhabditis nigoni TaxID=1611254 RepID=A0A2G5VBX8_9PELO|nr:hypothetical protein B9Z55_007939 [Caenorhabditis nigoni]